MSPPPPIWKRRSTVDRYRCSRHRHPGERRRALVDDVTVRLEGWTELGSSLGELPKATGRNTLRRTLKQAADPVAALASQLAPHASGKLAFSIAVSPTLTRRQRRGAKVNEVEMHIGPSGGMGALQYASFEEFGSIHNVPTAFMRRAWDAKKQSTLDLIRTTLGREIEQAAARLARKTARLAAGAG